MKTVGFLGVAKWSPLPMACVCVVGCDDGFAPPSRVDGLRVLAVRAEPPEVVPGARVALEPLVVDVGEVVGASYVWRTCILPDVGDASGGFDGFQVPTGELDVGVAVVDCKTAVARGLPFARELGTTATMELTVPPDLLSDDVALRQAYGLPMSLVLDAATREQLVAVAGVPVRVELEVSHPSLARSLVVAKDVRVSAPVMRYPDGLNENPTPPVIGDGCGPVAMLRGAHELVVEVPSEMPQYAIVIAAEHDGLQVIEREETWSYAFFATEGSFDSDVVKSKPGPVAVEWTVAEAGVADLWVVVRDGRGGTSWCTQRVAIE